MNYLLKNVMSACFTTNKCGWAIKVHVMFLYLGPTNTFMKGKRESTIL